MSDLLPIFESESPVASQPQTLTISDSQRAAIRALFSRSGILDAPSQFDLVEELTGRRIDAVSSMEASHAQAFIHRMEAHLASQARKYTGNAWDDREEDTWIDKL